MKAVDTTTVTAPRPRTVSQGAQAHAAKPGAEIGDCESLVLSNAAVNHEYRHLVLRANGPALTAQAGQFFNIACPTVGGDNPFFRRPMSLYRADASTGEIEFLYKVTGSGTRTLASLRAGDSVQILGPLGHGFVLQPEWKTIVVLGRGVGLATLAPLAELAASQHIGTTAILSARDQSVVMSVDRFKAAGADVRVLTDSDGSSDPAHVEHILRGLIAEGRADAFFTCGSNRLLQLMQRLGAAFNVPGQVAMEQQMACGLGMCFCCVRPFRSETGTDLRRVCYDGPVFDMQAALSW